MQFIQARIRDTSKVFRWTIPVSWTTPFHTKHLNKPIFHRISTLNLVLLILYNHIDFPILQSAFYPHPKRSAYRDTLNGDCIAFSFVVQISVQQQCFRIMHTFAHFQQSFYALTLTNSKFRSKLTIQVRIPWSVLIFDFVISFPKLSRKFKANATFKYSI